jgi:hypothetical protein
VPTRASTSTRQTDDDNPHSGPRHTSWVVIVAWPLCRVPVFAIAGTGSCRVRPVYVGNVDELAVTAAGRDGDVLLPLSS